MPQDLFLNGLETIFQKQNFGSRDAVSGTLISPFCIFS